MEKVLENKIKQMEENEILLVRFEFFLKNF